MNQEQRSKTLKKIGKYRAFNSFMFYLDIVWGTVCLLTGQFLIAGLMAFCAFLAHDTNKRLNAQEEFINSLDEPIERKNKTKVEDLYPSK